MTAIDRDAHQVITATAAAARAAGCEVTVIERGELPLLAVLGKEMAEIYAELHRGHGVEFRLGAELAEITGKAVPGCGCRTAASSRLTRWWSEWAPPPTPNWPKPRA